MLIQRNVSGLRQNAQLKRQESFAKVDRGIKQLIREKQPITFNAVAAASGVSKAWLYKEPEVKARIQQLRQQTAGARGVHRVQEPSSASKDAVIRTLKERIKKLEAENSELRKQNEVVYGQLLLVQDKRQTLHNLV